ncbi:hypothetical protein DFJ73DRAFT_823162 [Zopfochytrium polystomum]|nr:hypothetical protein DFJ73DRAFT_823162 [Zopfochytrium polystomum]
MAAPATADAATDRLAEAVAKDLSLAASGPELYSRGFCPFTQMVRVAFNAKYGADYTFTRWGPSDPNPDWFSAASPESTVPVLKKPDASFLSSSAEMIKWIDETYPAPFSLYKADGVKDEDIKEWESVARTQLVPSFLKVLMAANPAIQQEFRPKLKAAIAKLDAHLATHDDPYFFAGLDRLTIVDVVVAPILHRLPLIKYFRGADFSTPRVAKYTAALEAHPAFGPIAWPLAQIRKALITTLPKMKPMSAGRLQHQAILRQFDKIISLSEILAGAAATPSAAESIAIAKEVSRRVDTLILFITEHAAFEEEVVYPVFEEMNPGSTKRAHDEHTHEMAILDAFKAEYASAVQAVLAAQEDDDATLAVARAKYGGDTLERFKAWRASMNEHMLGEETHLFPMTAALNEREIGVFRKIYYHCCHVREVLLPFVMEFLTGPERMQYMHNISAAVLKEDPPQWKLCGRILRDSLPKEDWEDLLERLPSLVESF